MKRSLAILATLILVFVLNAQGQYRTGQQLPMTHMWGILRLVETIPLPGDGYMDHLAADVKGQRLFISGEAAKSLLSVALRNGKLIHETKGLADMPKKSVYLPDSDEIWLELTNSSVIAISGSTYQISKTLQFSAFGDPNTGSDNWPYDPAKHLLYAC